MKRKRFRLMLATRILLVCSNAILIFVLCQGGPFFASALVAGLVFLVQVIDLISVFERSNRELNRFLLAIEYADFSQSFTSLGLGGSYTDLSKAFTSVLGRFHSLRQEKEEQFQYLQTIVRNISTGLIVYDPEFKVKLFNHSAKKLLGIPMIQHLEDLKAVDSGLVQTLKKMDSKRSLVFKCLLDHELRHFSLSSAQFKQKGEKHVLVAIQDIGNQLEEKELEAWQKLIRVLTHEIMNSITPISSLSGTMRSLLNSGQNLENELLEDLKEALDTISSRSEGLMHFVGSYRSLTRIPNPQFKILDPVERIEAVKLLLEEKLQQNEIDFHLDMTQSDLRIAADPSLFEQVLINLFLNAIQAMAYSKEKHLNVVIECDARNRTLIHVIDSGPGIEKDVLDKVFIPFFTTKKNGSGIGLSLSRQIMRLHKGSLYVSSSQKSGAKFTLRF